MISYPLTNSINYIYINLNKIYTKIAFRLNMYQISAAELHRALLIDALRLKEFAYLSVILQLACGGHLVVDGGSEDEDSPRTLVVGLPRF
jgi:hypothetical protein